MFVYGVAKESNIPLKFKKYQTSLMHPFSSAKFLTSLHLHNCSSGIALTKEEAAQWAILVVKAVGQVIVPCAVLPSYAETKFFQTHIVHWWLNNFYKVGRQSNVKLHFRFSFFIFNKIRPKHPTRPKPAPSSGSLWILVFNYLYTTWPFTYGILYKIYVIHLDIVIFLLG